MEEQQRIPLIGEKFPEMEVVTTDGNVKLPDDYSGKWLILFSHPADFTPVCTTEFVAFQKRFDKFKKLNTELLGLSVDQVFSHIKWLEWIEENMDTEIKFPVIADDQGLVSKRLGFIHPKKGTSSVRAVFFIDPKSTIRAIMYYPPELGRNMDEFVRMIEAFQIADKENVAMPANWPNNEIVNDEVIIPPAKDMKTAKERKTQKKYNCFDWWLCHKKLK